MTENANRIISLDRDEMSELERELFIKDFKRVADEYFECDGKTDLEITRVDGGFLVCLLITARRVKSVKKPL